MNRFIYIIYLYIFIRLYIQLNAVQQYIQNNKRKPTTNKIIKLRKTKRMTEFLPKYRFNKSIYL